MDSAEHGDVLLPEEAIGGTTSHSSDEEVVDLNDLAHLVGRDERSLSGTGVDSDHHTVLELESEGGGTLVVLSHLGRHFLEALLESGLVLTGGKFETEAVNLDLVRIRCSSKVLLLFKFSIGAVDHRVARSVRSNSTNGSSGERLGETEVLCGSEIEVE